MFWWCIAFLYGFGGVLFTGYWLWADTRLIPHIKSLRGGPAFWCLVILAMVLTWPICVFQHIKDAMS